MHLEINFLLAQNNKIKGERDAYRSPKIAEPILTMFEPSSMAIL